MYKFTGHILTLAQNIRMIFLRIPIMIIQLEMIMSVEAKCFSFNNGIYCFRYEGAVLWNSLDPRFKDVDCLSNFKISLRKWLGKDCKCNVCFLCVLQSSLVGHFMMLHVLQCHCIYCYGGYLTPYVLLMSVPKQITEDQKV